VGVPRAVLGHCYVLPRMIRSLQLTSSRFNNANNSLSTTLSASSVLRVYPISMIYSSPPIIPFLAKYVGTTTTFGLLFLIISSLAPSGQPPTVECHLWHIRAFHICESCIMCLCTAQITLFYFFVFFVYPFLQGISLCSLKGN
jgi:hypothetical protein